MHLTTVTDQMGSSVTLTHPPRRIVSLVPSQTELLHSYQLEDEVCGITKFCIHPAHWFERKTHVGGTKRFDFDAIARLSPDLIIGNKEENYQEGIEKLRGLYPVWMSDICDLGDALNMMKQLGSITGRDSVAAPIVQKIADDFSLLKPLRTVRVLYLIWRKPWMAAGRNTFINDMLRRNGFENVVQADRYPELDDDTIRQLAPEKILLSSEPFPFRENHIAELTRISPGSEIVLVDGEMFSWYGSRLLLACNYFRTLQA